MLKEFLPIISSVALMIGGVAAFVWGLVSGFRKRAKLAEERVDEARVELASVLKLEAEAWRRRYEGEHQEYTEYRQKTHDKSQADTAIMLKLTTDLAESHGKTDLTPILSFQSQQSQINTKILQSLDIILQRLNGHTT